MGMFLDKSLEDMAGDLAEHAKKSKEKAAKKQEAESEMKKDLLGKMAEENKKKEEESHKA